MKHEKKWTLQEEIRNIRQERDLARRSLATSRSREEEYRERLDARRAR